MKRKFKVITTTSNHNFDIAPNRINRDFYSSNPNDKYVGDITYIKTKEGTMYLATVIDLYSRKVVGWSMDDRMKVSLSVCISIIIITSFLFKNYNNK